MVALARLGLKTLYIGKVGDDADGKYQLETLKQAGIDYSGVMTEPEAESQSAYIIVDEQSGERTILWHRDPRLTIKASEVDRDAITSARVLLLDGHDVEAAIVAAEFAREAGIPTVLDIDSIYPGAENLLPLIDFIISSSSFPERMTGEKDVLIALKQLQEINGCVMVAATQGSEGVIAYFQGEHLHLPAFRVDCRDTTGAGDAFHGGFIYGLLAGFSLEKTLRTANAVAGLNCRGVGARTSLPSLEEVYELMGSD